MEATGCGVFAYSRFGYGGSGPGDSAEAGDVYA